MIGLTIFLVVLVLVLLIFIALYNSIVRSRIQIDNAWAQIDTQLKRRHDLIPNLVNAVKGYMKYEQETLSKIIEARNKAISATGVGDKAKAEGELSGLLTRLFALFENYPELKASQNVLNLQEQLTTTENQIAFARQHYNDSVMIYNTKIQTFPGNIVASIFSFKQREFFEIPEAEKTVPQVNLEI
ncbi:MAG: LemA family protein [Candidatus Omnitrophica bacterium]|nr:LemA family protein [Candidatus Omnitrophota bacterium]